METTQNLKLPQYTGEDIFDLQDINKAYDSIDKAYGTLDDARKEVVNIKNEIPKTNATAEVISARGGKETLGKRLDEFGSQLETKTSKEETKNIQVKLTNDIETINSQLDNINNVNKKKIYQFLTVDNMKNYNIKVNEVCETLGYYSSNDGGGCKYLIEEQSKGLGSVLLTNGLYANIIFDNNKRINVLTLGVKRNVEEDQSTIVNEILKAPTKIIFYFPHGYYYFTKSISQNKRHDIIGDVVTTGDFDTNIDGTRFLFTDIADNSTLFDCYKASRCTIKNIYIISNAVQIEEDRTKHSTGTSPVDMFTITKSKSNIIGLSIGLFGNTIENVAVQGCNIGISGGTYNTFNNISFLECETGLQVLTDNQINLIRAIRCTTGINIKGGLNILTNIRFDSIQEYGITIDYGANYNTITGFIADWCQYGAISINSNNNYINGYIGRCGTYYANSAIGTAKEPEKACLVYLKNCNYNRLDIINNFESVGDSPSDIVKAPSYQIVMGQGGTNEYNNIMLTGKYGFTGLENELDIEKLKCLVCLNGSYGNTLLNVYGRQYRIKSSNGVYAKSNVVTSSLNPLK